MRMLRGDDAVRALLEHKDAIDYLVGTLERDLYIGLARAGTLHMLEIDERSIMAFHDEGDTLHIDIVTGAPGTIARVSELEQAARDIGYKQIKASTRNAGMRRVYRWHGMKDVECVDGEFKMALEIQ